MMIFTPTYCTRDMRSTQALLMGNRCENFIHSFVIAQYGYVGDGEASTHHGTTDGHHYLAYATIHSKLTTYSQLVVTRVGHPGAASLLAPLIEWCVLLI